MDESLYQKKAASRFMAPTRRSEIDLLQTRHEAVTFAIEELGESITRFQIFVFDVFLYLFNSVITTCLSFKLAVVYLSHGTCSCIITPTTFCYLPRQ